MIPVSRLPRLFGELLLASRFELLTLRDEFWWTVLVPFPDSSLKEGPALKVPM